MIPGYDRQAAYLARVLARGRLAHAYLFYGPDGAGMLRVAKDLAKSLHCRGYGGLISPAREHICTACAAIDADTHPGVILLDLEHSLASDKETRKKIPIEDVHELRRRFSLTSAGGAWRIAIIRRTDTMSGDAADAFLKLLEEPGERTLFLLLADARESVAPTLRSRAAGIRFPGGAGTAPDAAAVQAVRRACAAGIPEILVHAEQCAANAESRAGAAAAAIAVVREKMHAAGKGAERRAAARRLARMLDITTTMETTNVAPRLALDALLLEAAGVIR